MQTVKHVIDAGGGLTDVSAVVPLSTVVNTKQSATDPLECEVGETINGIFLSIYIIGATGSGVTGPIDWFIGKSRSAQVPSSDFPDPGATGSASIRNQIFHEEKAVSGSADGTPMAFKGVVPIPRGMRRQRLGDQFFVKLKMSTGDTGTFCVKAIYKTLS